MDREMVKAKIKQNVDKMATAQDIELRRMLAHFVSKKNLGLDALMDNPRYRRYFKDEASAMSAIGFATAGRLDKAVSLGSTNFFGVKHKSMIKIGRGTITSQSRRIFDATSEFKSALDSSSTSTTGLFSGLTGEDAIVQKMADHLKNESVLPFIKVGGKIDKRSIANFLMSSYMGTGAIFDEAGDKINGTDIGKKEFKDIIRQNVSMNLALPLQSSYRRIEALADVLAKQYEVQDRLNGTPQEGLSIDATKNDIEELVALNAYAVDHSIHLQKTSTDNQVYAGSIKKQVKVLDSMAKDRKLYETALAFGKVAGSEYVDKTLDGDNTALANICNGLVNGTISEEDFKTRLSDFSKNGSKLGDFVKKQLKATPAEISEDYIDGVEKYLIKAGNSQESINEAMTGVKNEFTAVTSGAEYIDLERRSFQKKAEDIKSDVNAQKVLNREEANAQYEAVIEPFLNDAITAGGPVDFSALPEDLVTCLKPDVQKRLVGLLSDPSRFGIQGTKNLRGLGLRPGDSRNANTLMGFLDNYQVGSSGNPLDDQVISVAKCIMGRKENIQEMQKMVSDMVDSRFDVAGLNVAAEMKDIGEFAAFSPEAVQKAHHFYMQQEQRRIYLQKSQQMADGLVATAVVGGMITATPRVLEYLTQEEINKFNTITDVETKKTILKSRIIESDREKSSLLDFDKGLDGNVQLMEPSYVDGMGNVVPAKAVLTADELRAANASANNQLKQRFTQIQLRQKAIEAKKKILNGELDGVNKQELHSFTRQKYNPRDPNADVKKAISEDEKKKAQLEAAKALNEISGNGKTGNEKKVMSSLLYFLGNADNVIDAGKYLAQDLSILDSLQANHKTVQMTYEGLGTCEQGIHRDTTNSLYSKYNLASEVGAIYKGLGRSFNHTQANDDIVYGFIKYRIMKGTITPDALRHMIAEPKYVKAMGVTPELIQRLEDGGLITADGKPNRDINPNTSDEISRFETTFDALIYAKDCGLTLDKEQIAKFPQEKQIEYKTKLDSFYKDFIEARVFSTDGAKISPKEVKQLFETGVLQNAPESVKIWYNDQLKMAISKNEFGFYSPQDMQYLISDERTIQCDVIAKMQQEISTKGVIGSNFFNSLEGMSGGSPTKIFDLIEIKDMTPELKQQLTKTVEALAKERISQGRGVDFSRSTAHGMIRKAEIDALGKVTFAKDSRGRDELVAYRVEDEIRDRAKYGEGTDVLNDEELAYLASNAEQINKLREAKVKVANQSRESLIDNKENAHADGSFGKGGEKQDAYAVEALSDAIQDSYKQIAQTKWDTLKAQAESRGAVGIEAENFATLECQKLLHSLIENEGVLEFVANKEALSKAVEAKCQAPDVHGPAVGSKMTYGKGFTIVPPVTEVLSAVTEYTDPNTKLSSQEEMVLETQKSFIDDLSKTKQYYESGSDTLLTDSGQPTTHACGNMDVLCENIKSSIEKELAEIDKIKDEKVKQARKYAFMEVLRKEGLSQFLTTNPNGRAVMAEIQKNRLEEKLKDSPNPKEPEVEVKEAEVQKELTEMVSGDQVTETKLAEIMMEASFSSEISEEPIL